MTQRTTSSGDGPSPTQGETGSTSIDFETGQREFFEAVGLETRSRFITLETRSRFITLETPRVRTHVFEAGPLDGDPPVVFVHGSAEFGAFFAPLVAQVDDVRTIAFDRPGYGLSDPFVYTETNLRRTLIDSIEGVLDELGIDEAVLVGHSMGGNACMRFALAHPDRVRRLVTVGAIPGFPGTRPPLPLRALTVPVLDRVLRRMQKSGEAGVLDLAAVFGERDAIQAYPAFIRAIAAHEGDSKSAAAGRSEFGALISPWGWRSSARLGEAELRELRQPTTVIWGANDPLGGPADVRDSVELIPDVRFETVDAGHIPYLSYPERCAQLIRG